MELLALLSNRDEAIIPNVKSALEKYTLYPLKTIEELEDLYNNIPLDLIIIDTLSCRLSSLESFLGKLDDGIVVMITAERLDKYAMGTLPGSVYDCINEKSIGTRLPVMVERILERQKFKNEIKLLKQSRGDALPKNAHGGGMSDSGIFSDNCGPVPDRRGFHEKVIVNFAKMLTASFDVRRLFDHFMDSVMELIRVSKMSVMLGNKEGFQVERHHGLDPYIADNLKLGKDSALADLLSKTGRIMNKPVAFIDETSIEIKREMELLQCSVSFPMIYKGRLTGIFNISNKITGEPFYREELEMIYVLCNYLAAAVKDLDFYHKMWRQTEFTSNILASMSSGMIAIDKDGNITIFNQHASEILNMDSAKITGSNVSALPSPMGNILHETMVKGTLYKRYEATINPDKIPVGINSYRLLDGQNNPAGAGIIFSDLSDSRKLEEQRRRTEKLEAVNNLMAIIAHEFRNPLTSIQTYIQLLNEKYTDNELNEFYISIVSQAINKLDGLIDKLVTFSSMQDYNLNAEDINDLMSEAAGYISRNIPQTHRFFKRLVDKSFYINADRKQLVKAIYFLVMSIVERTPDGSFITMSAGPIKRDAAFAEISISYSGDKSIEQGEQNLLKPFPDINNLGTGLNMPISHKIIAGHGGSIEIKREGETNKLIVNLPIVGKKSDEVSIKGGKISGESSEDSCN